MAEGIERPLDVLGMSQNKKIIVKTKQGEELVGTLKAFDSHINISMEDTELRSDDKKIKLGKVLIRGDSIVYISPGE